MAQSRKIKILSEGNTGILDYREDDGPTRQFIPFYDLDAARELLLEFQELKDPHGVALKDNYIVGGRDWFPSAVSWLYWHFFYDYVKYQSLVDRKFRGEIEFEISFKGEFPDFLGILKRASPAPRWKLELLHALIGVQNRRVMKRHRYPVMFYRFAREDFRSVEIRRVLQDVAGDFVEALPCPNFRQVLESLKKNEPFYYYAAPPAARRFAFQYDLGGLPPEKRHTWTALNPFKPDSALLESGLLGPVTFDVAKALLPGKNEIHVHVANLINNSDDAIQDSGLFGAVSLE